LVALYGGHVAQPPLPREQIVRVRLAQLPVPETLTAPQQPAAEPAVEAVAESTPQQRPESPPDLPPKELPAEPAQKPEPQEETPETPPRDPDSEVTEPAVTESVTDPVKTPAETAGETPPLAAPDGPAVSTGDVDFPFAYYLNLVEGRITRQWRPKQLGFREGASRSCLVHFVISRGGQVSRISIVESSGVALFDREALRAVQAASPLPPLPAKFAGRDLPVNMIFTLEPGVQ
jgi:TonB family protein